MNEKNEVLDIIIALVKHAYGNNKKDKKLISGQHALFNCGYLLNQVLRNYQIRDDHYHISKKAASLWAMLTSDSIDGYTYDEMIQCDRADDTEVQVYKGSENEAKSKKIRKNAKIKFNDAFHCEHTIPIKVIIWELKKLCDRNELTYENVERVLDNIHICRMLKTEDRRIEKKSNRPFDYEAIVNGIYKDANIELLD